MSHRVALVKILPSEYLEDFLNGELYLNTLSYFASLDKGDTVRADPHDGLLESRHVLEIAVQDQDGKWLPIPGIQNPVTFRSSALSGLNLLCFYAMTDRPGDHFDPRNLAFGDTAVVISKLPEFIARVTKAATDRGWKLNLAPVEYVDRSTHDGFMGPFRKFKEFAYQNELRLVFETRLAEACRLSVGNLRDITYITKTKEIQAIWAAMLKADA